MEPELQKYHLLHSLLPKVLLVFMEDFFFLYYSRNTRDLGKAKCWTNITPPPPHSHTCLREY
jgi:hypothetical protein